MIECTWDRGSREGGAAASARARTLAGLARPQQRGAADAEVVVPRDGGAARAVAPPLGRVRREPVHAAAEDGARLRLQQVAAPTVRRALGLECRPHLIPDAGAARQRAARSGGGAVGSGGGAAEVVGDDAGCSEQVAGEGEREGECT